MYRSLGLIAQYLDSDNKAEIVSPLSRFMMRVRLIIVHQRSFQALLPSVIQVIGQCVQSGNETGARQLFDVLETLLILVR
jgi:hypothetical protein